MDYILLMKPSLGNLKMTNTPRTKSTHKIQLVDFHTTGHVTSFFGLQMHIQEYKQNIIFTVIPMT